MQKFMKAIAAIMLTVAVVCAAGCTKPDDPNDPNNGENGGNNGGGNGSGNGETPTLSTEGIYLGIIGFNQHLYEKEISLLNESTKSSFISHIDGLQMKDGTGLYWADNTALMRLQSFGEPPKLTNVALVTFTDGLDNVSLDDNETNPDNYPTKEAYLEGLCNKIRQGAVHDKDITAYTIGLRGNDVSDLDEFHANLKKLASKDSNAYEVSDMNQALQKFTEIAESLHSVTMTASLTLLIPPGYNDGQICRFTFDNISSSSTAAENSTSYIECTYKRTENGRRLENITYHGWQTGASAVSSFEKVDRYYKVAFENLTKENGDLVSNDDKRYLQLFYKTSSGEWQKDSEFKPDTFSDVIEEQSSALIMLVLDCTTSLGSEFSSLKNAAKRFVETLVSSNNGGSNGGGGNGGGSNNVPTGAINGLFTINERGDKVYFSQGNLQYRASNNTWQFATNQYDYIGDNNSNISQNYNGWIDLFGWGTSGWNCGNTYYRPWDTDISNPDLYGPHGNNNLIGSYANSDWGVYNAVANGSNMSNQWRTLTYIEWEHIFYRRSTISGIRYAKAKVNGVNGLLVLPDGWKTSYYSLSSTNSDSASYSSNTISASQWSTLEQHGVVFLPASGERYETLVRFVGSSGHYWSASYGGYFGQQAHAVYFGDEGTNYGILDNRGEGHSVRLVCPAN
ncbi:MAG: VWA domain-containing protein [Bacteroidales bacterium]|nr:VWA domain-containing protein [Bacteroidales bacterium]MBR6930341.1 VWA domain-containing protein [Bacteroidales bacterium]